METEGRTCGICRLVFSTKHTLQRHVKNKICTINPRKRRKLSILVRRVNVRRHDHARLVSGRTSERAMDLANYEAIMDTEVSDCDNDPVHVLGGVTYTSGHQKNSFFPFRDQDQAELALYLIIFHGHKVSKRSFDARTNLEKRNRWKKDIGYSYTHLKSILDKRLPLVQAIKVSIPKRIGRKGSTVVKLLSPEDYLKKVFGTLELMGNWNRFSGSPRFKSLN